MSTPPADPTDASPGNPEPPDPRDLELQHLVADAQEGDEDARARLLTMHLPALRAFVRLQSDANTRHRESASDLVQTVCREVLEGLDSFHWENAAAFRSWLYTVAHNKVRTRIRYWNAARRSPNAESPIDDQLLYQVYANLDTASQSAVRNEEAQLLEEAFATLSEDHQQVILMSRLMGMPHAEIAGRMGRTNEAVRSLLSRALVTLASKLDKHRDRY